MAETRRQALRRILQEGPATVLDLAKVLHAPVKLVLSDLEHVARSAGGLQRIVARSAECETCGFVFEGRRRIRSPSRCPRCRSERIREAAYFIPGAS